MGHTVIDAADVEPSFGVFRKMRQALGATGFGINQLELPPGASGGRARRDGREPGGGLRGALRLRIDADRRRGRRAHPGPVAPRRRRAHTRMPTAGSDGLVMIMVGGTPGQGFVPRNNL